MTTNHLLHEYRIKTKILRPDSSLCKTFNNYPTTAISDVMESRNTLTQSIKPVWNPTPRLVGSAITVNSNAGDEILILKAIEIAKPGDIIIVAGNANPTTACWGGVMSAMAQSRGVKGLITDGMIRDVSDCRELKFPIWATGVTPIAPNSDIPPGDLNLPVSIGEVIVHPGDLVIADEDGVVIVPKEIIEDISISVQSRLSMEEKWIEKISSSGEMIFKDKIDDILNYRNVEYLD